MPHATFPYLRFRTDRRDRSLLPAILCRRHDAASRRRRLLRPHSKISYPPSYSRAPNPRETGERSNKSKNGVSLRAKGGRRSRKRLGRAARRRGAFRVKMHHGMGGSAGDCHGAQNTAMQARNGVCDKIENYISDLARWYVINRGGSNLKEPTGATVCFPPCAESVGCRRAGGGGRPGHESSGCLAFLVYLLVIGTVTCDRGANVGNLLSGFEVSGC